jgi:uncharacterized protein (TIGR02145 family)
VDLSCSDNENPDDTLINAEESDPVTDIDGNSYKTLKIGNQIWMAENLKTTKYNDGTPIECISWLIGTNYTVDEPLPPGYLWPQNNSSNKDLYGALYNGYALYTGKLAPTGWHVPSESEFKTLINYMGGETAAGQKLYEVGFRAQGAGQLASNETWGFNLFPDLDKYWTTTSGGWTTTDTKYIRLLKDISDQMIGWSSHPKDAGHSIRCIKNQ